MKNKDVMKKTGEKQSKTEGLTIKATISNTDMQAFKSLKPVLIKDLMRAVDSLAPYTESIKLFQERMLKMYEPLTQITDVYANYFATIKKVQKELLVPSLIITESLKSIVDSSKVFESLALSQDSIAKQLQGLVINLPLEGYFKSLSTSANFELTLDKFTSIKSHPDDYLLAGTAIQRTQHERIGLKLSTGFEMRLTSIESEIFANNEKLDYLIEKDLKRETLLEELVDYVKSTGSPLVKILKIGYDNSSVEIRLDSLKVKLRSNTNQSEICSVILSSEDGLKRVWEMEDIQEAIGEKSVQDKNWHRIIYDALKEVNTKILIESKGSISDFFILSMRTVTVNPRYTN